MKKLFGCSILAMVMAAAIPNQAIAKDGKGGVVAKDAVPMEYWALPSTMRNARLSPDGKYLALVRAQSKKGQPIVEILEVDNLTKKPHRIGADSMRITGFDWISNTDMTIGFEKQVSKRIKGFNQGASKSKLARFSMDDKKFEELTDDTSSITMVNTLPNDNDHVLMRYFKFVENESVRAPSFYKVNLQNGSRKLVLKGNREHFGHQFDSDGNPRLVFTRSSDNQETIVHHRPPGGTGWTEIARVNRDSFDRFQPAGLIENDPNNIYVLANNGHDKVGLWKYNIQTKSFGELVHRRDDVDLLAAGFHTNRWANPESFTHVTYATDKRHRKYFDAEEQDIMRQFEGAIPNAYNVSLTSRSKDGKIIVVYNEGPKDPGSYYLYNDGDFKKIGSTNSLLKSDNLGSLEYITYKARDGKSIHGYVTKPKGAGPHPLVVMPHGGPFVGETPAYDPWAQMLVNNGYMVLQPQYRGSQKYGLEYYKAGFINGGEGGKKMQDDKDDGAKYLIEKGLVDADRIAMFGWSYGGYAALIAASRSPNMYQCVIAGAAVADNTQQVNYYRNSLRGTQKVEQLKFWDDSINPIDEVSKVNVPMLIIHGSVDQRVPVKHSKKYVSALKKEGKDFEYVELKNSDHFFNTINYDHKMDFYPKMIKFLQNDCGPDGL